MKNNLYPIVAILIVLIVGFWFWQQNYFPVFEGQLESELSKQNMNSSSSEMMMNEDVQIESKSDNTADIESDLDLIDVGGIDEEFVEIEQELENL